jgi:hypothetical protein
MMPHLYTGGMPHHECMRAIRLFAKECLAEMKSWPSAPVTIDGDIGPGFKLTSKAKIAAVPDAEGYGYVYLNDRPALIDTHSNTVVWIE